MKPGLLITNVKFWMIGVGHNSRIVALVIYLAFCFYLMVIFVGVDDVSLGRIQQITLN